MANQPAIALSQSMLTSADEYLFVMMDLDVPARGTNVSRTTLLHAMVQNFKATTQKVTNNSDLLSSSSKGPATYISPSPPATDTKAHRYVQLLFTQPTDFDIQATEFSNTTARLGFDINAFMQSEGLNAPLAANFFTVEGQASGGASGTATSSGGIAKNTLEPFEGAVGRVEFGWSVAALMGGLALLAM